MEITQKQNIISLWVLWHFSDMPKNLLRVWRNYFLFASNYFSIPLLLKTLFSPWHRYKWKYPRGFQLWEYLETFLSNLIARIIGAIVRIILILIGIVALIFVFILGAIIFFSWLVLPVLLVLGFLFSFKFLL